MAEKCDHQYTTARHSGDPQRCVICGQASKSSMKDLVADAPHRVIEQLRVRIAHLETALMGCNAERIQFKFENQRLRADAFTAGRELNVNSEQLNKIIANIQSVANDNMLLFVETVAERDLLKAALRWALGHTTLKYCGNGTVIDMESGWGVEMPPQFAAVIAEAVGEERE